MKRYLHLLSSGTIRCGLGAALFMWMNGSTAQVSLYQFTQSVGTYTEITESDGGVFLGVPTFWPQVYNQRAWVNNPFNDPDGQVTQVTGSPAVGPGYPIGFPFTFNGDVFDVIGISNGGWISFGKSTDNLQAVSVYNVQGVDPFNATFSNPTPSYKRNRVAGFGNSGLQQVDWTSLVPPGSYSRLQMATIGTAPNRVCVVQWKEYGLRNDVTVAMNVINFQIRLYENDNSVETVLGPMTWVSALGRHLNTQSGLSGRTSDDFNGRMTVYEQPAFLYDWNNTVAANSNQSGCQFAPPQTGMPNGSGIPPVTGLTWRWTPPVCPPPAWPFTVDEITFSSGVAHWTPNAAGEYEYFVSTENSINGPETTSGTTSDPEAVFEDLAANTTYYVFVRSICGGEPGTWSVATPFKTLRGGVIVCDGTVEVEEYCSIQYDVQEWMYISADGSPLRVEFLAGFLGNPTNNASFRVWLNGASPNGPPSQTLTGDLTGQAVQSPDGQIRIRLTTDAGACHAQDWYLPLRWRVGCKNCTDPQVNYSIVSDCANQQYSVVANIWTLGTASTVRFDNDLGVAPTEASTTGAHTVGPFPAGSAVMVTTQSTANQMCYNVSAAMINEPPCAVETCGPTNHIYCYGDNEWRQWAYQGSGGQEIGIRFIRGSVGLGDDAKVYNGADPFMVTEPPTDLYSWGGFANTLVTSHAPSTDRTLVLELVSDGSHSCADEDPVFGNSGEWEYVVACYDGCTQPQATFASSCLSQTQYQVTVNVNQLGSTGSVTINNNGGQPAQTVSATGAYTVGPFTVGTPVNIDVVGASVLCTWTAMGLNPDCSTVGIQESSIGTLRLFPNPNGGDFQLELPAGRSSAAVVEVLDIAGRVVVRERVAGSGLVHMSLDVPAGLYTLILKDQDKTYTGRVSIQH